MPSNKVPSGKKEEEAAASSKSSPTPTTTPSNTIININIGILGHVDSGKTSLVKALSTHLSTAALDKSKQSRERGMTLDLGFSCFYVSPMPRPLLDQWNTNADTSIEPRLQVTLVDCPGHASLIRTIIGGAQIIDAVVLVIDAVKGWQAQTTECLVLAELCSRHVVVALNKLDQLRSSGDDDRQYEQALHKAKAGVRKQLQQSRKFATAPIVGVAACVGGEKVAAATASTVDPTTTPNPSTGLDDLLDTIYTTISLPHRITAKPNNNNNNNASSNTTTIPSFTFAVDHCFPVKGRGTVITGTCLSGSTTVGSTLVFPDAPTPRKIKSIQVFSQSVSAIHSGDRAGICVSQLDSKLLERGLVADRPIPLWQGAIALVRKIVPYYTAGRLAQQSKFHVSVGHTTVMATVTFWGGRELLGTTTASEEERYPRDVRLDYQQDFLQQPEGLLESITETKGDEEGGNDVDDDDEDNHPSATTHTDLLHWAWLQFETPVRCPQQSLIIGSRLDHHNNNTDCRLAFAGRLCERHDTPPPVRWYTPKERRGVIARLGDAYTRQDDGQTVRYEVFGTDLFKKETDMQVFIGMRVVTKAKNSSEEDIGEIKSSFGTAGKCRIVFPAGTTATEGDNLVIRFKRYANDPHKAMHQDDMLPAARPGARIVVDDAKPAKKKEVGVHRYGSIASLKGDVLPNGKYPMAIVAGFFDPQVNIKEKVGRSVVLATTGEQGHVVAPFGKAGKCKVEFPEGVSASVGDKTELLRTCAGGS